MRIAILNGDPDSDSEFGKCVHSVARCLAASGHEVTTLDLVELDLKGCCGCWGCWVKTPGECARRDGSAEVCRAAISADLLVLASPITMGFTSALLKRAADQMIPLLHPYITLRGGEMHHRPRYGKYPALGLLLGAGADCDAEDVEITTAIWERTARNFVSRVVCTAVANRPAEEIANDFASAA
jgi:multimeric flavodoxin WrbA